MSVGPPALMEAWQGPQHSPLCEVLRLAQLTRRGHSIDANHELHYSVNATATGLGKCVLSILLLLTYSRCFVLSTLTGYKSNSCYRVTVYRLIFDF